VRCYWEHEKYVGQLRTWWEYSVRTWWEHIGNNKNSKNPTCPILLERKKKLGPLDACWFTSLVAKKFYTYLCSLLVLAYANGKLEWTSNHQCTNSGWGHSSRFGDQPKTHPLPLPRDFSVPLLCPKIFPSYLPHLISRSLHLQSSGELLNLSSIELWKDVNTRLDEGGEFNVEGM